MWSSQHQLEFGHGASNSDGSPAEQHFEQGCTTLTNREDVTCTIGAKIQGSPNAASKVAAVCPHKLHRNPVYGDDDFHPLVKLRLWGRLKHVPFGVAS